MAEKQAPVVERNEALEKVQSFWNRNGKTLTYILGGILLVVGGWLAYQNFIVKPKSEQAANSMFKAEQYFAQDSFKLALNGDGQYKGFLYIINNYGGTKESNLAKYYAGISYLKLGEFNKAAEQLKNFSTSSKQIQMMAYGALGDAYSEAGKKDEAVEAYTKAAKTFEEDEFNSSEFLYRAALLSETMGKNKEAVTLYKELKTRFPKTDKGYLADKYLYRLEVQENEFTIE